MCGREIGGGILCDKCDKPRRKSTPDAHAEPVSRTPDESGKSVSANDSAAPAAEPQRPPARPAPEPAPVASRKDPSIGASRESTAAELDHFPKAPILPFPVESASPAITSVVHLLIAGGVPAILLGPDRTIKFASDEARRIFDASQAELADLSWLESKLGVQFTDLTVPMSSGSRIGSRNFIYTLVPMSGGASGAALVFRSADDYNAGHASFATYVKETILGPLKALQESMHAIGRSRNDHFLIDSAAAVDQILSSLELAPEVEEPSNSARPVPNVTEVVRRIADRFRAYADLKGITLQTDVQELSERIGDHDQLSESLGILMENALHYVPAGGQVVVGVRWMEHKGKPLLLFFVMDNGPLVPDSMRQEIFEPSFVWNPASPERTGRGLFKCREFALAHAGSVWVESKTGKACTFFLRVRPDDAR